jgi:fermentation-respiration switch protein FrsA (DUF1100 family)
MSRYLREELITVEHEGSRIHGMLHFPKDLSRPVPAVMLLHGFTGSSTSDNRVLVRQARHLAEVGIAALRFDFRGSGQSEGEFCDMTLSGETSDAVLMFDLLSGRPEIDPSRLGLLGLSMGGAIAGCVLARRDDVRAAVLWAPVAYPYELMSRAAAASGRAPDAVSGQVDVWGDSVGSAFLMELPLIQPLDGVLGSTVPLLVLHGSADPTVPVSEGMALFESAAGIRKFTLVEGADHTFQSLPWRAQLHSETTAWFKEHL